MAFRFRVVKTGRLHSAGAWLLDGKLLSGRIENNTRAVVESEQSKIVNLKTVALLNRKNFDPSELTLTMEEPDFDIQSLEGKIIKAG